MVKIKRLSLFLIVLSIFLINGCDKLTEPINSGLSESPRLSPSFPWVGTLSITPNPPTQGQSILYRIQAMSFNDYPLSAQIYICRNEFNCDTSYSMVKEQGDYFNYTLEHALSGNYYLKLYIVETGGGTVGPLLYNHIVNGLHDPTISNVNAAPSPINQGSLITFSATINPNQNTIDSVQVIVDNSQTYTMAGTTPALVSVNSSLFSTGTHQYVVKVNFLGNTAQVSSSGNSFTVNAPPQPITISNTLAAPNPVLRGAQITFNSDITSNIGSNITNAKIIFQSGAERPMTKTTGNRYTISLNSNNFAVGTTTYSIKAYDALGNIYTSNPNSFVVNPSSGPTISNVITPSTITVGDTFDITTTITLGSATNLSVAQVYVGSSYYTLSRIGSTTTYKATIPSSSLGTGTYSVSVVAVDNLQNQAYSAPASLTISGSSGTPTGNCGNSVINSGEDCDLTNLNSQTCITQGFDSGTLSCSSSCTFNIANCIDTTKPAISNIKATEASTSATIKWETNELADSKIEYGKKSEDYDKDKSDSEFKLNHSLTITKLSKDTKYYYVIISTDRKGNEQTTSEKSFTTGSDDDTTIPGVSSKQVSSINSNGATIYVTPTEASIVTILYGTASGSYSFTKESSDYVTNYNIHLDNLQPGTKYYYRIELEDTSGNTYRSSEESFNTLASSNPNNNDDTNDNTNNNNNYDYPVASNNTTNNNYTMYVITGILLVLIVAAVFFMKKRKPKRSTFKPVTPEVKPIVQQPQIRQVQQPIQQRPQEPRNPQEIRDEERVLDGLRRISGNK